MATLSTLVVKLVGDTTGLSQSLADAKGRAEKFGTDMQAIGGKVKDVGVGLTAAVTAPVVGLMTGAIGQASDLSETMSKVNVVFGESAQGVLAYGDNAAKALGQSKQQALEAAGTFGNFFVSMGMGQQESAKMSMGLVTLASDLASFNNMNPTEALEKLRAGMAGETEPLRSLGVNLNAAAVASKAMSMGIVKTSVDMAKVNEAQFKYDEATRKAIEATEKYGVASNEAKAAAIAQGKAEIALNDALGGKIPELTAAQKATATYALIMEQTKTAQGDFARTSDGLANSQRIVAAQIKDLGASFGEILLPYVQQGANWLKQLLTSFSGLSPEMRQTIVIVGLVAAGIGPLLIVVGQLVSAVGILSTAAAGVGIGLAPLIGIILAVVAVGYTLYRAWTENWGGIQQITASIVEKLTGIINSLAAIFAPVFEAIKADVQAGIEAVTRFLGPILTTAMQAFSDMLTGITVFLRNNTDNIRAYLEGVWGIIRGIFMAAFGLITGDFDTLKAGLESIANGMMKQVYSVIAMMLGTTVADVKAKVMQIKNDVVTYFGQAVDFIKSLPSKVLGIGSAIVNGIAQEIRNAPTAILGALSSVIDGAIAGIKARLGIASPAKVPGKQVGLPIALGIARGMLNGLPAIKQAALALADGAMPSVNAGNSFVPSGSYAGNSYSAAPSITINATLSNELDLEMVAHRVARIFRS